MSLEIKAPTFPESVADGTVATWHKKPGEPVKRDELIVDIETDKVVLEIVAPNDGTLKTIFKNEGDVVLSEEVLAVFEEGAVAWDDLPVLQALVKNNNFQFESLAVIRVALRLLHFPFMPYLSSQVILLMSASFLFLINNLVQKGLYMCSLQRFTISI